MERGMKNDRRRIVICVCSRQWSGHYPPRKWDGFVPKMATFLALYPPWNVKGPGLKPSFDWAATSDRFKGVISMWTYGNPYGSTSCDIPIHQSLRYRSEDCFLITIITLCSQFPIQAVVEPQLLVHPRSWWWIPGKSLVSRWRWKTMQRCRNEPHLEQETMCFFLGWLRKDYDTHTLRLVIWQSWHPLSASISPMTPMILDQIWRQQPFLPKMVISWGYNGDMHNLIWLVVSRVYGHLHIHIWYMCIYCIYISYMHICKFHIFNVQP